MWNYLVSSGHLGGRWLHITFWREFHWQHMSNDAYISVSACQSCAAQGRRNHHRIEITSGSPAGPLNFLPMEVLGLLSETKSGIQHRIFLIVRFTDWPRAIPFTLVVLTNAATVFVSRMGHPIWISGLFDDCLRNGGRFQSFRSFIVSLGVHHSTATVYHHIPTDKSSISESLFQNIRPARTSTFNRCVQGPRENLSICEHDANIVSSGMRINNKSESAPSQTISGSCWSHFSLETNSSVNWTSSASYWTPHPGLPLPTTIETSTKMSEAS